MRILCLIGIHEWVEFGCYDDTHSTTTKYICVRDGCECHKEVIQRH